MRGWHIIQSTRLAILKRNPSTPPTLCHWHFGAVRRNRRCESPCTVLRSSEHCVRSNGEHVVPASFHGLFQRRHGERRMVQNDGLCQVNECCSSLFARLITTWYHRLVPDDGGMARRCRNPVRRAPSRSLVEGGLQKPACCGLKFGQELKLLAAAASWTAVAVHHACRQCEVRHDWADNPSLMAKGCRREGSGRRRSKGKVTRTRSVRCTASAAARLVMGNRMDDGCGDKSLHVVAKG